ncbi:unnamed protein product, partial [Allacma fusca]
SQTANKKKLRFAHNRKTLNEQTFRQPISVFVPRFLDEENNVVLKRVRVMFSSGLFWFWEKWDKLRFPKCLESTKMKVIYETPVKPLSMESSIVLAIYGAVLSNILCFVVFAVEVIHYIGV